MQSTSETTPTETFIENAARQRRLLRRGCWAGIVFVVVAILFVVSQPLYVRWQLRQHGWKLSQSWGLGLPDWAPQWAVPWFGRIDFAVHERSPLQASDLNLLRRFPNLQGIILDSTEISEPAFESLSKLSQVERVTIRSARLDAVGLRHLATHPKLKSLSFDVALDDNALKTVATCPQLIVLGLTGVTDENLRHVSRLHRLPRLVLTKSHVTDDGSTWLADNCSSLEILMIQGGPMTDLGLAELARLPKLRTLSLQDMTISDDGILKLKSCPLLQTINVKNTKVTSAGVTELRKSLPTLKVSIE